MSVGALHLGSGSATALVHEVGSDGVVSTGDVEGNKGEIACSDIDLSSESTVVHEGVFGRDIEVIDGMMSDLKSWTTLVVHEGTSVDVVSRGGEVGVL
jgi:hypothetical protein